MSEGLLLVVWTSIELWAVGWLGLGCGSKVFTLRWVGLGWVEKNWTHGQLCSNDHFVVSGSLLNMFKFTLKTIDTLRLYSDTLRIRIP